MKVIMWKAPEAWLAVDPVAVAAGSQAQMANVLAMALQDLAALSEAVGPVLKVKTRALDAPLHLRRPAVRRLAVEK